MCLSFNGTKDSPRSFSLLTYNTPALHNHDVLLWQGQATRRVIRGRAVSPENCGSLGYTERQKEDRLACQCYLRPAHSRPHNSGCILELEDTASSQAPNF